MNEQIPPIVQKLSEMVSMTPVSWNIYPHQVVIVFEEGPKLIFDKDEKSQPALSKPINIDVPGPKPIPARKRATAKKD